MNLEVGQVFDNRFKLIRKLGSGGMGSVWEVMDHQTGRRRAVKVLHERLLVHQGVSERFLREAYAAFEAKFSGHIVEVLDVVHKVGTVPYIVMEYLEGRDLCQILQWEGALEQQRAVDLIIQACNGLDEVHRRGLIHRDIKPANLFVTNLTDGSEWVILLDFGLVKLGSALQSTQKQLTRFGAAIGTVQYMAPEQVTKPSEVDLRADVFSLGVVLYELLANAHPYDLKKLGVRGVFEKRKPTPLHHFRPNIDPGLEKVIAKAMAVKPKKRWESMFAFIEALEPFSSSPPQEIKDPISGARHESTIDETLDSDTLALIHAPSESSEYPDQECVRDKTSLKSTLFLSTILVLLIFATFVVALRPWGNSSSDSVENTQNSPEKQKATTKKLAYQSWGMMENGPEHSKTGKTPVRWIQQRHNKRLGKVLDGLSPAIFQCLEDNGYKRGSKILVHFFVNPNGSIRFRNSIPRLRAPARRCVAQAAKTVNFNETKVPRFVTTHLYEFPVLRSDNHDNLPLKTDS